MGFNIVQESGRPVTIKDEGLTLVENVGSIDFTGTGITGSVLGTDVTEDVAGDTSSSTKTTYTKQQNFGEATLTDGATISWDLDDNQVAKVTLAGDRTMNAPTNMVAGGTYILRVIQDGTGTRLITWNSVFKWVNGEAPTLSTGGGDIDILTFYSDGTNMNGVAQANFS